ncbi:MAG: hypothetical protein QXD16_04805 [Sulfolobales archaeon]
MSYILPAKPKGLIERALGYVSGIIYRSNRYLPKSAYMKLIIPPNSIGIIANVDEDFMPFATVTLNDPNFINENYVRDRKDDTWGNAPATSVPAGAEVTELTYNLGLPRTGFIYVRVGVNSYLYTRIYVSQNGSTYTQVLEGRSTGPYSHYSAYVTDIQYIQVRVYNSSSSAMNLSDSFYKLYSLEFYPTPGRTVLEGDDAVKIRVALAYNTVYQLLEVHEL